jgi:uncharacterized protein (TIGR03067 family)
MRRRIVWPLCAVPLVALVLGSDAPREYDGATVPKDELEGTWRAVAVEIDGSRLRTKLPSELTFRAGRWWIGDRNMTGAGSYTAEAGRKPAHLDIVTAADTNKYLYRIDGDTLRMARTKNGDPRPRTFDDADLVVFIYQRVKR